MLEATIPGSALSARVTFDVQVNPCVLTTFTTTGSDQQITYTIGQDAVSSDPYGVATQTNACNYPQRTEISSSPSLPNYIDHDPQTRVYTVNKIVDDLLAGIFVITVKHVVTYQVSASDPTLKATMQQTEVIKINVMPNCRVTNFSSNTVFADPVVYILGEDGFDLPFDFEQTSIPIGCTLPVLYDLSTNKPSMLDLVSISENLTISKSFEHD